MFAYLFGFTSTGMLGYLASKADQRKKIALCLLAVLPLCLLAGLRSLETGKDIAVYVLPLYEAASSSNIVSMLTDWPGNDVEPLFSVYVWLITNIFHDINVLLFALQLAVILPLAYVLLKESPNNIALGLLVYSFLFFSLSLNIMRQSIAAGFLLLAYCEASKNRALPYVAIVLLSIGFHATGVLGFLIWPAMRLFDPEEDFLKRKEREQLQIKVAILGFAVFCLLLIFGKEIIVLISEATGRYSYQVEHMGEGGITVVSIAYSLVALASFVYIAREEKEVLLGNQSICVLLVFVGLAGLFAQFSVLSTELCRLGLMFLIFAPLYYSKLSDLTSSSKKKIHVNILAVASSIGYWFWVYIYNGGGSVYPYMSTIIPLLNF